MAQSLQEQQDALEAAAEYDAGSEIPGDEPQNTNPADGESAWLEGEGIQRDRRTGDDEPLDAGDDTLGTPPRGEDPQGTADANPADGFTPEVLQRAAGFGMSEAQARALGSPQAMEQAIQSQLQMLMPGQWGPQPPMPQQWQQAPQPQQPQQQVSQQQQPQQPYQPPELERFQFSFNPDDVDPVMSQQLQAMAEHNHNQAEKLRQDYESQMNEMFGYVQHVNQFATQLHGQFQQNQQSAEQSQVHDVLKGMGEQYQPLFGVDPANNPPGSLQHNTVAMVNAKVIEARNSYLQRGMAPPPLKHLAATVVAMSFPNQVTQASQQQAAKQVQKTKTPKAARPTRSARPSGRASAIAAWEQATQDL